MKKSYLLIFLILSAASLSAQEKAVDYKTLQKKLPTSVEGYSQSGSPEGSNFEMNDMSYSTVACAYKKGNSKLNIAIFDYHAAQSIFQASTMAWSNSASYENQDQKAETVTVNGMNGWLAVDKKNKNIDLLVSHKDRYFVSISISNSTNQALIENVAKSLKLSTLP